ncbi:Trans-resveratrol di-O-methyltransferase [Acorus gramineus]|uniref:Trans-resveratrol di-O-methyltransferase n=1 Tax=Acorus gramineus TaxID=55184 RepID=A0AAV9AYH4_ACOGR|nr:Trans-resveratrol di-O-methyltransferase [Acorus gramineus]
MEKPTGELIQAQSFIWNHLLGVVGSMSLKCAVQLGIPDAINRHGGPITLPELADALSVHPAKTLHLRRLMRTLAHSGFFEKQTREADGEEMYSLATASKYLLKDQATAISPFLLTVLDPVLIAPWHSLGDWLRRDETTPFHVAHGESYWELMAHRPDVKEQFNEAMACDARLVIEVVVNEYGHVFKGLRSLVDIGGNTGTTAKAITKAFPHVRCTTFDLPHVIESATRDASIDYVGGDMFERVPSADAVMLKWILHDWGDEDCVKILKRCKEAIPKVGGKVILIDMVVNSDSPNRESTESQYFFDMLMMVLCEGREREEHEWKKLFKDAGFTSYRITPALGLRSIIELYP